MLTRNTVISFIARQFAAHDAIRAAWLGGSDANGRADALSDVDVFLVVEPGSVEACVSAIESDLARLSPIALKYRLGMPTWHGFHQAFYQLRDAPEHLMIDWLMIERGQPHPWLEMERHGTPRVLFDKDGVVQPVHADRALIHGAIRKKVEDLRVKFPMLRHLPAKLARRGLPVDAAHFYQALVMRPLLDMLRAVHCPDRHDYGFRYARDDLPVEAYAALRRLMYPPDQDGIGAFTDEAVRLFDEALDAWDRGRC